MTAAPSTKLDPARLAHIRDLAAERLAVARACFERMRECADDLKANRAVVSAAEEDLCRALPSQRGYYERALSQARTALASAEAAFAAADARYHEATATSEIAGRLHTSCRDFAISQGLIPDPRGGYVQKEAVA